MIERRPTPADLEPFAELVAALDTAVLGFTESTLADVRQDWKRLDLDRDAWAIEVDGRLAGLVSLERDGSACADGYVHPDFRGRGIGTRLVALSEQLARERGAPKLMNGVLGADERAAELLEGAGYSVIRHYYRLVIDLDEAPAPPTWPEGLELTTIDRIDPRAFHAAVMEGFAQEWDHHYEEYEAWRARRIEGMAHDPSLFWAVLDGDEVAATAVCDAHRFGMGWVGGLAVREPWRRRGLGLALLQQAFCEFHRRGERRVGLAVDAQNPTGATRLYERAGMRLSWSATFYEKDLA